MNKGGVTGRCSVDGKDEKGHSKKEKAHTGRWKEEEEEKNDKSEGSRQMG